MRLSLIVAALLISASTPALADRPISDSEKARLVEAVTAQGCSGGKMEFEDGKFEVSNAKCSDGKIYELHFDQAFKLLKKELET